MPEFGFPGLEPGDRWCLRALRWQEAFEAGPRVGFACHSRGRLGLLLARRSQTVGSGPGVTGGMMSDQQSFPWENEDRELSDRSLPRLRATVWGVVVRLK
jgi:hypothetical protein